MSTVSLHAEIRDLKKALAAEHRARVLAEHNIRYFKEQTESAQLRLAKSDGMKSVGAKRRLLEDQIRSSKLFQDLVSENIRLSQQLESCRHDRSVLQDAMANGRAEVQRQLQIMLNEADLLPARREYYERLVNDLDIHALMALHRDMKFFDDRG
jgi:hypothetical protein